MDIIAGKFSSCEFVGKTTNPQKPKKKKKNTNTNTNNNHDDDDRGTDLKRARDGMGRDEEDQPTRESRE